jgi:hypothetical protein
VLPRRSSMLDDDFLERGFACASRRETRNLRGTSEKPRRRMRSEFLPEMRLQGARGSRAWLTIKDKAFLSEDASPGRKHTARSYFPLPLSLGGFHSPCSFNPKFR